MKKFSIYNRGKARKAVVWVSWLSLLYNIKLEISLIAVSFRIFFVFKVTYRLVSFHIEIQLLTIVIYSQMKQNEQNIRFRAITLVFF